MRAWYFVRLNSWVSSILSSQGTVNSISLSCMVAFDHRIISGLRLVVFFSSGNLSCLFRSTCISQWLAVVNMPLALVCVTPVSPALTKVMNGGPLEGCLGCFLASSTPSANWFSTWPCLDQYFPSARLEWYWERKCSRIAVPHYY